MGGVSGRSVVVFMRLRSVINVMSGWVRSAWVGYRVGFQEGNPPGNKFLTCYYSLWVGWVGYNILKVRMRVCACAWARHACACMHACARTFRTGNPPAHRGAENTWKADSAGEVELSCSETDPPAEPTRTVSSGQVTESMFLARGE